GGDEGMLGAAGYDRTQRRADVNGPRGLAFPLPVSGLDKGRGDNRLFSPMGSGDRAQRFVRALKSAAVGQVYDIGLGILQDVPNKPAGDSAEGCLRQGLLSVEDGWARDRPVNAFRRGPVREGAA